ncbi:MAG: Branched-chain amino acid transport system permease protein LivM, partial [uncultured Solirubrobacteraceae bacterium]
ERRSRRAPRRRARDGPPPAALRPAAGRRGHPRRRGAAVLLRQRQPVRRGLDHGADLRLHGARPQRGGRLRRPARPRLRGLLRDRRLQHGLVRLELLHRRQHPHRGGRAAQQPARHPPQLPADRDRRGAAGRGGGRDPRRSHAAPARRLHRHRDPRLRRDHRAHRGQQRRGHLRDRRVQPHQRPSRHHAGRQDRPAAARALHHARPAPVVLHGAGAGPAGPLHQPAAARLASRTGVDRGARGRGRRGQHGHPDRAREALRVRDRRRPRRRRGGVHRHLLQHRQRRPVRVLVLDLRAGHDHPRRPRLDLGSGGRGHRAVVHQHPTDTRRAQRGAQQARPELRRHRARLRDLRLPAGDHDGPAPGGDHPRAPAPGGADRGPDQRGVRARRALM